jgi:hypothetical protein
MAVTIKNVVFWYVTQCDSLRTDISEERIASIIRQIRISDLGRALAITVTVSVTADALPGSMNVFTLMMEAIIVSETFVLRAATRRHIPEVGILHAHCQSPATRRDPRLAFAFTGSSTPCSYAVM